MIEADTLPIDRLDQIARVPPKAPPAEAGVLIRALEFVKRRPLALISAAAVLAAVGGAAWVLSRPQPLPIGFAFSNGRLEAERIDIATKLPGRIKQVLVQEGDTVSAGQVVARMDTAELEAQIREAEAVTRQAAQQLKQAQALAEQRRSELVFADAELERSLALVGKGYTPRERVDQRRSAKDTAIAVLNSANAQIALSNATIEAAAARVESLRAILADSVLVAPRAGRIQYRLALGGEVLPAGGKVLTLLDLGDVYMTIYLPTADAGRLAIGSQARIVFDAAPVYVVPASVSFVAADAQFTPKFVETKTEREKLMFRIKLRIPSETLARYAAIVKTGVPGVAYVQVVREAEWPAWLAVSLPK